MVLTSTYQDATEYMKNAVRIIRDRLYFLSINVQPGPSPGLHFFSVDDELIYENFYADFGPPNLAQVYRYCRKLNEKLKSPQWNKGKIIHFTSQNAEKRVNAAFLMGCYQIIQLHRSPEDAYGRLCSNSIQAFIAYRDASLGPSTYHLPLLACLCAISKAVQHKFLDFETFNVDEYEHYEKVENGDLNWIIPDKIIAFCSPHSETKIEDGYPVHSPDAYISYFQKHRVSTIIRLNKKLYDAKRFTNAGFSHFDLIFADGTYPPDSIMHKFLQICEEAPGAIAVHCKAGLGRTGTLISCYLMKHYRFTSREAIAWCRVCRPGSVIGPQQHWLDLRESACWTSGDLYRATQQQKTHSQLPPKASRHTNNSLCNGFVTLPRRTVKQATASEAASDGSNAPVLGNMAAVQGDFGDTNLVNSTLTSEVSGTNASGNSSGATAASGDSEPVDERHSCGILPSVSNTHTSAASSIPITVANSVESTPLNDTDAQKSVTVLKGTPCLAVVPTIFPSHNLRSRSLEKRGGSVDSFYDPSSTRAAWTFRKVGSAHDTEFTQGDHLNRLKGLRRQIRQSAADLENESLPPKGNARNNRTPSVVSEIVNSHSSVPWSASTNGANAFLCNPQPPSFTLLPVGKPTRSFHRSVPGPKKSKSFPLKGLRKKRDANPETYSVNHQQSDRYCTITNIPLEDGSDEVNLKQKAIFKHGNTQTPPSSTPEPDTPGLCSTKTRGSSRHAARSSSSLSSTPIPITSCQGRPSVRPDSVTATNSLPHVHPLRHSLGSGARDEKACFFWHSTQRNCDNNSINWCMPQLDHADAKRNSCKFRSGTSLPLRPSSASSSFSANGDSRDTYYLRSFRTAMPKSLSDMSCYSLDFTKRPSTSTRQNTRSRTELSTVPSSTHADGMKNGHRNQTSLLRVPHSAVQCARGYETVPRTKSYVLKMSSTLY